MEKNKKPARSRLKECRNYPRISDNEGNNENNDDSGCVRTAFWHNVLIVWLNCMVGFFFLKICITT